MKKIVGFLIIILIILANYYYSFSGSIPTPTSKCEGTQMLDGTYIPAGQVREITYGGVKYRCVGCGNCTPISSHSQGSSYHTPSHSPSRGLSPSQQMAIGLMGAFLSGFFGALFDPPDFSDDYEQRKKELEEQKRRQEEERKKEEEIKKQILSQYNSLLTQAKTQMQTQQSQVNSSSFTFQTLGGQLTSFQWNSPSLPKDKPEEKAEAIISRSDINSIMGNVIQDKMMEKLDEKIEDFGGKIIGKVDEKYKKQWGSKFYERGIPIMKIAVTAKTEGVVSAGVETINYGVSLIPMPALQGEVADVGRKIYTRIAFTALDKFLSETEKAADILGFNFNKDEFIPTSSKITPKF